MARIICWNTLDQEALGEGRGLHKLWFSHSSRKAAKRLRALQTPREQDRLTVAIAVVNPLLAVLGRSQGFLQPSLFHDGTGILPGPLFESPGTLADTAHHDQHEPQQKEEHNHPRQMLVDVEMLVQVLPGVAPLGGLDGRAGLLPSGLHGCREQLQDVSVVGALLVSNLGWAWEGLVRAFLPTG